MIRFLVAFPLLAAGLAPAEPAPIPPRAVLVVYNENLPDSKELADHYARLRKIPRENLVGLKLPGGNDIPREDYEHLLRRPLVARFDKNDWWARRELDDGMLQPVFTSIRVIVCMRGVPYRIPRTPAPDTEDLSLDARTRAQRRADEASVDSELTVLGVEGYSLVGPLRNPYYKKDASITKAPLPGVFAVGRIDGPSWAHCRRMMDDAKAVEKEGLWGMAYLDLAKKGKNYELGDQWIRSIARDNARIGIPTVVDSWRDTFVTNYPMKDAAFYYGWYAHHRNGPLLNPAFRFQRGAVAVHLHSFSAAQLRAPTKHWCGPILAHGAAATLGNVHEPFLAYTHNFDIFHDRLLKGYSLAEAAYMSVPTLSWQAVVLGDPLYRPFPPLEDLDLESPPHREYKILRTGWKAWHSDQRTLIKKIRTAAARLNSGLLYEAAGLFLEQQGQSIKAAAFFESARKNYLKDADKLRQELHLADLDRRRGDLQQAVTRLLEARAEFQDIPESKAASALATIINPPPPPPAQPSKPDAALKR